MKNKFLAIYGDIEAKIKSGDIKPDTLLPSEHELTDLYHTSRETIRKALHLLSQNGYIQKVRGKGSVVIDINKFDFPVSGLVSFKELAQKMDEPPKTIVSKLQLRKPDQFVRQQLNLSSKEHVWEVIRVREINGQKIILDKDYLAQQFVPHLTEVICADSIYNYLENELGLTISFAKKEIVVEEPTEEDELLLDLDGFHNVVIIKNYVYLDDASLFQYTESRHRPDKFRFVDFARRIH
ncbi:trehalose operon repressor [Aquibacillus salsiterrae]|uniref:Trehalose operon repressor n=1 Tax=Aquibacillus salsiterrae TaxID=2950439 RepID=A0A9X3WF80_9BACI|nr:trehalose operon repressor [Aquibacillus salsiterrae]MDC3417351.1 trehalose operon repressor [Aquibacillus salsiterrae]